MTISVQKSLIAMALSTLRDTADGVIAVFGIYNNDLDLREIFEHSLRIVIKC